MNTIAQPRPTFAPPTQQRDATSPEDAPAGFNFTKTRKHKQARSHRATAPQLITRDRLDHRRNAVATFDKHARAIQNDLGGYDALSTIQLDLIESFVGASLSMQQMNARLMLGEEIDLGLHALTCGAMVRIASRLGVRRVARDVSPSLSDLLKAHEVEQS